MATRSMPFWPRPATTSGSSWPGSGLCALCSGPLSGSSDTAAAPLPHQLKRLNSLFHRRPGYSHLLDVERDHMAALKAAGRSIGAIAKAVGRAKSTVSRELRRNALPSGRYSPLYAAGAYHRRRRRKAVLERDRRLRDFVGDRLAERWTPEQIAGWLKAGHECGLRALGFEAI